MILTLQRVRKSSCTSATVITRALPYLSIVAQVLWAARLLWHLEGGCSRCVNWTRFPPTPSPSIHTASHTPPPPSPSPSPTQHNRLAQHYYVLVISLQFRFSDYDEADHIWIDAWQHRRAMQITASAARKNSVPVFRFPS